MDRDIFGRFQHRGSAGDSRFDSDLKELERRRAGDRTVLAR